MVKQEHDISKGIVHPEIKQNLSFTHPHIVPCYFISTAFVYTMNASGVENNNGRPLTFLLYKKINREHFHLCSTQKVGHTGLK